MPNHLNLSERLRRACDLHLRMKLPWPKYILHEAADEIDRLQKVEASQLCFMCSERVDRQCLPPIGTVKEAISAAMDEGFTSVKAAKMLSQRISQLEEIINKVPQEVHRITRSILKDHWFMSKIESDLLTDITGDIGFAVGGFLHQEKGTFTKEKQNE